MLVGIISDTHDRLPMIDEAVRRLNEMDVELVFHAGDYVSPFVADHFKPLKAPLIGVFGNNDGDRTLLKNKFAEIGADIRGNFAFVTVDGLTIALLHGDEKELMRFLLELESHDVLVSGHTHVAKTYRKGRTLVINPGEACGYLKGKPTIAILDTYTLDVKTIRLKL
ncbi:MAG TPA: metallophosphoesterase [Candidatus Bathyarchaeota archaeon]|nr:metallophosphoesterase [Candidatus Bathyarchaeota archaeon]